MAKKFSFLFLSTDDFATPTLGELNRVGDCLGVVTTPPRPRGRGRKVIANPIYEYAKRCGLNVIYTDNPKDGEFINMLKSIQPDFLITLSFPYILPKEVITVPKWPVNIHPSILPRYRGPAPIRWVLINGEEKTGITTILMNEKVDAGSIIDRIEINIEPEETYGELRKRLALLAPGITNRTIENLIDGSSVTQSQDEQSVSYAPKITKEMTEIRWEKTGREITNLIRGLSPAPGARTSFRDRMVKILSAALSRERLPSGRIETNKKILMVGTGDLAIMVKTLKIAGSKEMSGQEFINGFQPDGEKFG